jgi:hypothetical protein
VLRFAWLAWLLAVCAWSSGSLAQAEPCPRGAQPWVEVIFSGSAWSDAVRQGVIRELQIELSRRSLEVCPAPKSTPDIAPQEVVTLLASDPERVSIVGSNIENEGGFTGRTIMVGTIPDDARALAIAQAVDEALRTRGGEPAARATLPVSAPVARPAARWSRSSGWVLGAAVAPTLQLAPAASGLPRAAVAPGVTLRLSLGKARLGGSLGVAITRASDLSFDGIELRDFRVPADLSFGVRFARGPAQATLDIGMVAALVNYEYRPTGNAHSELELGGRAGLRFGWGHRFVPWLGASIEVLPSSSEFRFAPTGVFGRGPALWLGFALGTEVRWL